MIVEQIEELKKKGFGVLDKDKIMENLFLYIKMELGFLDQCEPTQYALGRIKALVDMSDVMCVISARCGLTINVDGHGMIHDKKKMELLRKIGRNTETD